MESIVQWSRLSEQFLAENMRDRRCLWDHKHDSFMKKGLKRKNYLEITLQLRENFPELADLYTDQVRTKFNNLKAYFNREYKKIQCTPSGSAGKPSSKWELFDVMCFLKDTVAPHPTYSSDISNQVNSIDTPLVIEVDQNTFDSFPIGEGSGESSMASLIQPVTPNFDQSSGDIDQTDTPITPTASSSAQSQKPSNSSKKRKLQNSFEEECLQTLKELDSSSNTSKPTHDDFSYNYSRIVEDWLRSLSAKGQKVASLRISKVLMDVEEEYGLPDDICKQ
ncbi:uncharacterized protein LOC135223024 [Macrobrachium nipponense]|uniref:uncharacterized protein LOC135223024 n=1 Tax=Macrobrachium nipponense TaxID=159736 RepID=UPI0030C8C513